MTLLTVFDCIAFKCERVDCWPYTAFLLQVYKQGLNIIPNKHVHTNSTTTNSTLVKVSTIKNKNNRDQLFLFSFLVLLFFLFNFFLFLQGFYPHTLQGCIIPFRSLRITHGIISYLIYIYTSQTIAAFFYQGLYPTYDTPPQPGVVEATPHPATQAPAPPAPPAPAPPPPPQAPPPTQQHRQYCAGFLIRVCYGGGGGRNLFGSFFG